MRIVGRPFRHCLGVIVGVRRVQCPGFNPRHRLALLAGGGWWQVRPPAFDTQTFDQAAFQFGRNLLFGSVFRETLKAAVRQFGCEDDMTVLAVRVDERV